MRNPHTDGGRVLSFCCAGVSPAQRAANEAKGRLLKNLRESIAAVLADDVDGARQLAKLAPDLRREWTDAQARAHAEDAGLVRRNSLPDAG